MFGIPINVVFQGISCELNESFIARTHFAILRPKFMSLFLRLQLLSCHLFHFSPNTTVYTSFLELLQPGSSMVVLESGCRGREHMGNP